MENDIEELEKCMIDIVSAGPNNGNCRAFVTIVKGLNNKLSEDRSEKRHLRKKYSPYVLKVLDAIWNIPGKKLRREMKRYIIIFSYIVEDYKMFKWTINRGHMHHLFAPIYLINVIKLTMRALSDGILSKKYINFLCKDVIVMLRKLRSSKREIIDYIGVKQYRFIYKLPLIVKILGNHTNFMDIKVQKINLHPTRVGLDHVHIICDCSEAIVKSVKQYYLARVLYYEKSSINYHIVQSILEQIHFEGKVVRYLLDI